MLTQLFSFILTCLMLSACGTAPAPGNLSAAVTQMQTPRFPEIPPPGEFDTIPEHGDFRRLMVGPLCPDRCRPGPLAWIQPRASAATWGRARRDSGEVIARMISYGAYPKFNLQDRGAGKADTVYWAVMKVGDSVVSIFRSTTPRTPDKIARTEVTEHGEGFFRGVAWARWVWSDQDDMAWGTCDGGACCRSPGLQ